MIKSRIISLTDTIKAGADLPIVFIMGPCVIENEYNVMKIAQKLKQISSKLDIQFVFKASFDKANRTSSKSFRGVSTKEASNIFRKVKKEFSVPVTTDVHETIQIDEIIDAVDIIQIPAFLIRQTDLVVKAASTGKCLNLKKGQFISPWEMDHVINKVKETGNPNYFITERGTFFGYNRLVNDFKYFPYLKNLAPVCYDATHSVQLPGLQSSTGGEPENIEHMTYAAIAAYTDLLFFETHFSREEAKSDASNLILLNDLERLLYKCRELFIFTREKLY